MKKRRNTSAIYRKNKRILLKKRLKQISIIFISLLMVIAVVSIIYVCRQRYFFPITTVHLFVNQEYIDTNKLKQLISQKISGNFFTLSLTPIVKVLLTDDQIKAVSIRRIWPQSLFVYIDGYEPIAFLNKDKVITIEGYTFKTPKRLELTSPVYIQGPEFEASHMIKQLYAFNKILKPLDLTIKKFIVTQDLYSITLSNGLKVMLGDHDRQNRLSRFVKVYAHVIGHCENHVASIDLRYPNGLAIKWNDHGKCIDS